MTRQIIRILIIILCPLFSEAQELKVQSFELSPMEIIANNDQRKDLNGDACALIKVQVMDDIDRVEGNVIGNVVSKGIEKWVYLTHGTKFFRLHFLQHFPITISCTDYQIDGMDSKRVYILRLIENGKEEELSTVEANIAEKTSVIEGKMPSTPKEEEQTTHKEILELHEYKESESVQTFVIGLANFKMIHVEGGSFMMGGTEEQGSDALADEGPCHAVTLNSFNIGETEVTQLLWEVIMKSNPSYNKAQNRPVEKVSWNDCMVFLDSLNVRLADQLPKGRKFRLPTEAEWEFAARGGVKSKGYKFAGSNDANEVAWFSDNCGRTSRNVKDKKPNELGLYDMSGNVYEWCADVYSNYSSSAQTNPAFLESEDKTAPRVYRGGGWSRRSDETRVSARFQDTPNSKYTLLGLRLAF